MKKIFAIIVTATLAMGLNSCYSDPAPGTGVVIVKDVNDFRVPGCYVRLSQPGQNGNGIILKEGYTDANGEFAYTHTDPSTGLALEVILNIYAAKDGKTGQGIIRIKPDETTVETVHIL